MPFAVGLCPLGAVNPEFEKYTFGSVILPPPVERFPFIIQKSIFPNLQFFPIQSPFPSSSIPHSSLFIYNSQFPPYPQSLFPFTIFHSSFLISPQERFVERSSSTSTHPKPQSIESVSRDIEDIVQPPQLLSKDRIYQPKDKKGAEAIKEDAQ